MSNQLESTTITILKKSFIVFLFTILATPLGYLMRILFSRSLSIEMFGLFYAVLAFVEIFMPFQDFGMGFSLSYHTPKLLKKRDFKSIWLMFIYSMFFRFIITMIISVTLILSAPWLALNYFKIPFAETLLSVFSVYLLISSVTIGFKQLFIGLQKEKYYVSAEPLRLALIVVLSGVAWFLDRGQILTYALIWNVAYACVALYYLWLVFTKHRELIFSITWQKSIVKKLTTFSVPLFSNSIIYLFTNQVGLIFLTFFHNVTEIGVYNVILPIVSLPSIFLGPLQTVFFPMVSEFMQSDRKKVQLLIENMLRILPFITIYFNFFIFLFPQYTLGLLFSNKWLSSATFPLMIISLGYIFNTLANYLTRVVDGMGLIKERMKMMVILATINIVFGGLLIYYFGVLGLVITNSLVFLLTSIGTGLLIYPRIKFSIPWFLYLKYFAVLVVLYALVAGSGFSPNTWYLYMSAGLLYTVISVIFAVTQGVLEKETIQMLIGKFKSKKLKFII